MPSSGADRSNSRTGDAEFHVLFVVDYDIFDRFGRMLLQLGLGLAADGLRVSVLTDDPVAAADFAGTPVQCHWIRFLSGWLAAPRIIRFLGRLEERPDLVHVWGTACLDSIAPWARRAGVPILVHALSPGDVEQLQQPRWRSRAQVLAGCRGLHALLARSPVSEAAAEGDFSPAVPAPAAAAEAPAGDHVLGMMWNGRLVPEAGLDALLGAVATLRARNCELQLALIGAGPAAALVRRRIRQAGVADRVSLIEEPDLWQPAISGMDVCVVPARQEEIFLAPLMAMALGKIVIASRDQAAEWFIEDRTSWSFSPGSVPELVHCLERALAAGSGADELRRSAQLYTGAHHGLSRLTNDLRRAYGRALGRS